jgi:hypothetical protein
LFRTLLEDGFTGEPVPFDPAWTRYLSERHAGIQTRRARERFEHLILRQIADLHSMTPEQLENIERYVGGPAPSGETFQHTDLAASLDLASRVPVYGLPKELGRGRELYS